MEVVLPIGDLLRTGMGAMTDNKTFVLYKGYVSNYLLMEELRAKGVKQRSWTRP